MRTPTNCSVATTAIWSISWDAGGEIAAVAVGEESHPQAEQPPDEAVRVVHGEPHRQESEAALPQPGQQVHQAAGQGHSARQRGSPLGLPSAQDMVDEHAQQERQDGDGERHQQPAEQRERQRSGLVRKPGPQPAEDAGAGSAGTEVRSDLEAERDAGEPLVELLRGQRPVAVGRIVHQVVAAPHPLQHQEVIELPEDDQRHRHVVKLFRFPAPALGFQSVAARGARDVGGVAAVPVDGAHLA